MHRKLATAANSTASTLLRKAAKQRRIQQRQLRHLSASSNTSSSLSATTASYNDGNFAENKQKPSISHIQQYRNVICFESDTNNHRQLHERRLFSTTVDQTIDSDSDEEANDDAGTTTCHRSGVRNVAIIAHVDHGKTTLVDQLLRAAKKSGGDKTHKSDDETDRLLDCGDLEKERGITITSKVTRIDEYIPKNNGDKSENDSGSYILNLVDTPGHADFCGEVDRVLSLVDGVCLVVDAGEGPMAQTKYVLSRALQAKLPIVVVLNKVDRKVGFDRVVEGDTEISLEELMEQLGASEDQIRTSLDNAVFYASARDGWVTQDLEVLTDIVEGGNDAAAASTKEASGMHVLLDRLLELIPEPAVQVHHTDSTNNTTSTSMPGDAYRDDKFSLAAVTVGYDSYLGRTCTGRITSGHITASDSVTILRRDDNENDEAIDKTASTSVEPTTLKGLFVNRGISRVPLESEIAYAGDIVTLAGVPDSIRVGDTVTGSEEHRQVPKALHTPPLVPPTLSMEFAANNGPLAGTEGTEVTPSKLRNRLVAETDNNVTLTVESSARDSERTNVYARGELQLGILIEQMRREGFEMVISPPSIVTTEDEKTGTLLEPFEEVTIDVDSEYSGYIVQALTSDRKGILLEMQESPDGKTRLVLEVPSRGLLGFPSAAAAATRGSAIVNHVYLEDRKHAGPLGEGLEVGKLVSSERGKATTYALASLAARGTLFVEPGDLVYPGMIVGENAKPGDMEVNPVRAKAATNMRTQNKDEKVYLAPPKKRTVEELIGYMAPDEMIEVTPTTLRLRKAELDPTERKKAARVKKQQQDAKKKK